eukprot:6754586-Pyramimonas_sp.AAC.2
MTDNDRKYRKKADTMIRGPFAFVQVKAPTYQVVPDGSKHSETALLIFHAGPPYEDIAFKIVNKDWEYSHKKGFKCSFERGIMHLYIKCAPSPPRNPSPSPSKRCKNNSITSFYGSSCANNGK